MDQSMNSIQGIQTNADGNASNPFPETPGQSGGVYMSKKKDSRKTAFITFCIFGILCGVASIVLSICVFFSYTGSGGGVTDPAGIYGADFYTEMAQGVRNISVNTSNTTSYISYLTDIVKLGLGSILVVFGASDIFYFLSRLVKPEKADQVSVMMKEESQNDIPAI